MYAESVDSAHDASRTYHGSPRTWSRQLREAKERECAGFEAQSMSEKRFSEASYESLVLPGKETSEGEGYGAYPSSEARSVGDSEVLFHVEDARTNWGHCAGERYLDDEVQHLQETPSLMKSFPPPLANSMPTPQVSGYNQFATGAVTCSACESCGHVNMQRCELRVKSGSSGNTPQREEAPEVHDGGLANVFFAESTIPKLAGGKKTRKSEVQTTHFSSKT